MIYLDNAATTAVSKEALQEMFPYFSGDYGNPGGLYQFGRRVSDSVSFARTRVARLFGCSPERVLFTSGGSEGNSTVFHWMREYMAQQKKSHLVISAVEHDSVLHAAACLERYGFRVTYVRPEADGTISPSSIEDALQEDTALVSVMYVNNETGAVNDIREIGKICRARGVLFHTDCVQAAGQYPLDVENNYVDFATVSAHKIHGPKGIGALYVRNLDLADALTPLVCGGSEQEFGLRGGTENVPGIVGFGEAAAQSVDYMKEDMLDVSMCKQSFYNALRTGLEKLGLAPDALRVNGPSVTEPGKILNFRIDGVDAQTLLLLLDSNGICMSAGSACRSRESVPSHVLTAMGLSDDEARASIRVSFSRYNTPEEAIQAGTVTAQCAYMLLSSADCLREEAP